MNLRILVLLCVLVSVLLVSGWLHRGDENALNNNPPPPRGYYLTNAHITQTGVDGQLRYALSANRIEQDLPTDRVNLTDLTLQFRTEHADAWQLRARTGWLDNHAQQSAFAGAVTINPSASPGTWLLTDTLRVDLAAQTARTNDNVTLRMNEQQVTAKGLFADIKTQKLKLESQVHGIFSPPGQLGVRAPQH